MFIRILVLSLFCCFLLFCFIILWDHKHWYSVRTAFFENSSILNKDTRELLKELLSIKSRNHELEVIITGVYAVSLRCHIFPYWKQIHSCRTSQQQLLKVMNSKHSLPAAFLGYSIFLHLSLPTIERSYRITFTSSNPHSFTF